MICFGQNCQVGGFFSFPFLYNNTFSNCPLFPRWPPLTCWLSASSLTICNWTDGEVLMQPLILSGVWQLNLLWCVYVCVYVREGWGGGGGEATFRSNSCLIKCGACLWVVAAVLRLQRPASPTRCVLQELIFIFSLPGRTYWPISVLPSSCHQHHQRQTPIFTSRPSLSITLAALEHGIHLKSMLKHTNEFVNNNRWLWSLSIIPIPTHSIWTRWRNNTEAFLSKVAPEHLCSPPAFLSHHRGPSQRPASHISGIKRIAFRCSPASLPGGSDVRPGIIESSASHLRWMKGHFDILSPSTQPTQHQQERTSK